MYPATVRRQIVLRLRSGEAVAAVAAEIRICQATLFRWKRQALIEAGAMEGITSVEADELAAAHKRIAAHEAELALTRDACELFNREAVVPQNADARSLAATRAAHAHSGPGAAPADLVNRQFTAIRPNELWCIDIIEHPARDGKVCCCASLDCFPR